MKQYYDEQELNTRIREIRSSKEWLTEREEYLIYLRGYIEGTSNKISHDAKSVLSCDLKKIEAKIELPPYLAQPMLDFTAQRRNNKYIKK